MIDVLLIDVCSVLSEVQENLLVYVMVSVYSALETGDLERQLIDVVLIIVCSVLSEVQENLLVYVMVSVYSALETGDLERQLIDVVLISVCSVRGARKPAGVCNGQCLLSP